MKTLKPKGKKKNENGDDDVSNVHEQWITLTQCTWKLKP